MWTSLASQAAIGAACIAVAIIVEFTSAGATFNWRGGNLEGAGTQTAIAQATSGPGGGAIPLNTPTLLVRPWYASMSNVNQPLFQPLNVAGGVIFHAVKFITSTPGAQIVNLGIGGTKTADWAGL